ncbi:MAG: helix-turn-helix domain-containing protein [Pseudomonadota bacterium]
MFGEHLGASPIQVARTMRVQRAKRLLNETALPMQAIAVESGFGSVRGLNAAFHKLYGRPPSHLRPARGRPPQTQQPSARGAVQDG